MTYEEYHRTPHTIETERLLLRRLVPEDDEAVYAYGSDPEVSRYVSFETHTSIETAREFLQMVFGQYERGEPAVWAITLKSNGVLIGTIGLLNWVREHLRTEVGYAIAREYWNNGYVSEALHAVCEHLFTHTDLIRIEARCNVENIASARVMEKAGMSYEGVLRKHLRAKGENIDVKMYALLASDDRRPDTHR